MSERYFFLPISIKCSDSNETAAYKLMSRELIIIFYYVIETVSSGLFKSYNVILKNVKSYKKLRFGNVILLAISLPD